MIALGGAQAQNSALLKVRGTAELHGGAYITHPIRPLIRPHDYHPYFAADGRAETNSFNFDKRGRHLRTILTQFEARGVLLAVGSVQPALIPQMNYLLLGR